MKRDINCMDEQVYFGRLLDAIIQNTNRVPIHNMTKGIFLVDGSIGYFSIWPP